MLCQIAKFINHCVYYDRRRVTALTRYVDGVVGRVAKVAGADIATGEVKITSAKPLFMAGETQST